jgi:hypothetical protein
MPEHDFIMSSAGGAKTDYGKSDIDLQKTL